MKTALTRRQFLKRSSTVTLAAAALPQVIPASVLGAGDAVAPSNRVVVAGIGVGPQGRGDLRGFLAQREVQVVAVCDVAQLNLDRAVAQVNGHYRNTNVKTYHDFREVLARPDLDAVLIATPDHWHVPVAIAAAKAGKDMYLEKPMGLSVEEDQRLRQVCRQKKRIFQFGTQQRSSREFRRACELVRNGHIGQLKQIDVWCAASRPGGSTRATPVPAGLNYDFWLGPARYTPYTPGKAFDGIPQGAWKTWWFNYDYALGFIAGWGVHPLDIAYWGHPTMMDAPLEVEGKGLIPTDGACNTSVAWDVNFKFGDGVRLWYRGTRNHCEPNAMNDFQEWRDKFGQIRDHGTAFEGTDGWVHVYRGGLFTHPAKLAEEKLAPSDAPLTVSSGHQRNFIECVKSRRPAICPIEDAVIADTLCHLSDVATRVDRKLTWDPKKEQFIKDDAANQKLKLRPFRAPWKLG